MTKNNHTVEKALKQVLVDTYGVYFKTHSYHWNVEGLYFNALHTLFETHYTEMWAAIDEIAERLRALGVYAPINYTEITANSNITEDKKVPTAKEMIVNLIKSHEQLINTLHKALEVSQNHKDEVTSDVFLSRLHVHEKTLWMLKSLNK